MILAEARTEIQKAYLTVFNGVIPIALDNQDFTPPDPDKDSSVKWVRLSVQGVSGTQACFGRAGNRRFDKTGLLTIQVFTPSGTATAENDQLCQDSLNVFEGIDLHNDMWFKNGRIDTVGTQNSWFQQNVTLEFTFQQIK